jgi:hypothetical protein
MKLPRRSHLAGELVEIGWREVVGLPELQIEQIKAKVDTGARTSALHAVDQEIFERDGRAWIGFTVPSPSDGRPIACSAPVADRRAIKNTSGVPETRHIIRTELVMGQRRWHIEVSLSDRSEMEFDLILGRAALRRHRFVVNPGRSFLLGPPVGPHPPSPTISHEGLLRTLERGRTSPDFASDNGEEEE